MKEGQRQKDNWIFFVLVGKTTKSLILRFIDEEPEIQRLEDCIASREFVDVTPEEALQILTSNYYIGTNLYRHLRQNYSNKKKAILLFSYSEQLRVSTNYSDNGKIHVYIPKMKD